MIMIDIQFSRKKLYDESAQGLTVFCRQDAVESDPMIEECASRFYKPLKQLMRDRNFTGKAGDTLVVSAVRQDRPITLIFIGLGNTTVREDMLEQYRRALGSMIRTAEKLKIDTLACPLIKPESLTVSTRELVQETTATTLMAHYQFRDFFTQPDKTETQDIILTLCMQEADFDEADHGRTIGLRIGHAVNQARYWDDLPGNHLTPTLFAEHMRNIAQTHDLTLTVLGKTELCSLGMGGICAVGQGSIEEPRMVIMEYHAENKNAPVIALVGKGITFDTGGISIKPSGGMEAMKDDMAGAAAVVSTIAAISHLKPSVNVIALAPLAENMPSGTATRPGDIIRFYNGTTAEVKNTDAEGRLILADALAYAAKNYKPDIMIDIATLTGACIYALGPFFAGLLSRHDALAESILASGCRTGDRCWRLPMTDDYRAAIKSDVADICNTGNEKYRAGTITAGFFLSNFVGDTTWAHLDIAGTSYNVPDRSYYRSGGTGFGVRLLIDLIMNYSKENRQIHNENKHD